MNFFKNISIILVLILLSCANSNPINKENLTFQDFKTNLKPSMDHATVINLFGKPTSDVGNGLHVLVYELSDSTRIVVSCSSYILYAQQEDKKQQVLEVIF